MMKNLYILNYLNFLITSITSKAKEISVELNHDCIKEEDLKKCNKKSYSPMGARYSS